VFHTVFNLIGIIVMLPLLNRLVLFLEKIILDDKVEVELPRYLNKASMGMADAAVEAARKETTRLYDLAVDVISDGLSIQRDAFRSDEKIKRVVKQSGDVIDKDIDDLYERKLKALYGAIVEFVIHTRGGYAEGQLREVLNDIRQAGQHVIEAVKGVKHLKKNLIRFMQSDNDAIRKEYDKLRRLIVKVLREIDTVRTSDAPSRSVLSLDKLKLEIEEKTDNISNGLEKLIRKQEIDVLMATSLMNAEEVEHAVEHGKLQGVVVFGDAKVGTDPANGLYQLVNAQNGDQARHGVKNEVSYSQPFSTSS